ncbi:MAG: FAD-dependent oxidoreductase, partial [Candidatus Omnitrophota bacterium]
MYDLTIVGAGWAGFSAATKARDLGLKVALVEKGAIGGTCLNR